MISPYNGVLVAMSVISFNIFFSFTQRSFVGTMGGELKPMDYESDSEAEEIDVEENVEGNENTTRSK